MISYNLWQMTLFKMANEISPIRVSSGRNSSEGASSIAAPSD